MTGKRVAQYEILEKLGEGGTGTVYKARDSNLNRLIAIKVLRSDRIADADRKRRFLQEARTASSLNHPGIVHIYDVTEWEGRQLLVMEYVRGATLDSLIGNRGLGIVLALKYSVQIADALSAAHSAGNRPSRSQTRQLDCDRGRPGENSGFRAGEAD